MRGLEVATENGSLEIYEKKHEKFIIIRKVTVMYVLIL